MSTTGVFGGCRGKPPPAVVQAARPANADDGPPQFIDDSFEKLYPLFLLRKLKPGPKAALWNDYFGRWVKWTGTVRSFTANGITLKQIPPTVTFDVSLWVEMPQQKQLRQLMRLGDRVTYIGRLDSYDDIFRTLYLKNGQVLANLGAPAAGN